MLSHFCSGFHLCRALVRKWSWPPRTFSQVIASDIDLRVIK